jgi:carbon monoxide dehydrogenase subunit G
MPETTFRHRAVAPAPAATVWDRLQDPAVWAGVAGVDDTSHHRHDDGLLQGFHFSTRIGGVSYRGSAQVVDSRPSRGMVLAIRSNELTGSITVEMEPVGDQTSLEVTMSMRPAGILGTVVFPVVTGAVQSGFADSVDRLALHMG